MRIKYSLRNSITSIISNIISFIFVFISQTLFIKILGIEYAGVNGLFSNVFTLLSLLELGIGEAIIFYLYKYIASDNKEKIKSLVNYYKKAYYLIAFAILLVGCMFIPFLKYIVNDVTANINITLVYILFLFSTIATYILSYKRSVLFAYQKNYSINIIHVIYLLLLNFFQILVLCFTKNFYYYLILKIIFVIIENLMISLKVNRDYPFIKDKNVKKLDISIKKDIKKKVKALFFHKMSASVTFGTDNILISIFLGIKAVGLYTNYYNIIYVIKTLCGGILESLKASVGNLLTEKNIDGRYVIFKRIVFFDFWISTFTSACFLVLIPPFIRLWLGEEYLLSNFVLVILIINYFQIMMKYSFNLFKDTAGIWVEDRHVPIIQMLSNVIFSVILLKIFGLAGVFMGTVISSFSLWFYSHPIFVYKKLFKKSIKDYYKGFIKYLFIFILVLFITFFAKNLFIVDNNYIDLLLGGILCIVIPNVILYLLFKNSMEYEYFMLLLKCIRKK